MGGHAAATSGGYSPSRAGCSDRSINFRLAVMREEQQRKRISARNYGRIPNDLRVGQRIDTGKNGWPEHERGTAVVVAVLVDTRIYPRVNLAGSGSGESADGVTESADLVFIDSAVERGPGDLACWRIEGSRSGRTCCRRPSPGRALLRNRRIREASWSLCRSGPLQRGLRRHKRQDKEISVSITALSTLRTGADLFPAIWGWGATFV